MTEPVQFPYATPRHGLPLLFAGQAQKEFFVNAAFSLSDVLLHPLIEAEVTSPPEDSVEGYCWLIAADATGEFAEMEGKLAYRQAGEWRFAAPSVGMRVYDRSKGQFLIYHTGWTCADPVEGPQGGSIVDTEARIAIGLMLEALEGQGILPQI